MTKLFIISAFSMVLFGIYLVIPKYEFIQNPNGSKLFRCNKISGSIEKKGIEFTDHWSEF